MGTKAYSQTAVLILFELVYFNTVTNSFLPPFVTLIAKKIAASMNLNPNQTHIPILFGWTGFTIPYGSVFSYSVSISVFLQCICFILFGVRENQT